VCRLCAFTGDAEAAEAERDHLYRRRALLFSGAVESLPSVRTHWCRNDEEYGKMARPMRVTMDGGYTELWCPVCMRYLRMMIPTSSRSRSI
jgi:hypothetical protein